jgi:ATP-binding cassette subfamily C (CFTR/MRP) protein 1
MYASALVSLGRISKFLIAEELAEPYEIHRTLPLAVQVNGDFTWETVLGEKKEKGKAEEKSDKEDPNDDKVQSKRKRSKKTTNQNLLPSTIDDSKITGNDDSTEKEEPPFSLNNLRFEVPKGAFVAIVGRVGCGKVSREVACP